MMHQWFYSIRLLRRCIYARIYIITPCGIYTYIQNFLRPISRTPTVKIYSAVKIYPWESTKFPYSNASPSKVKPSPQGCHALQIRSHEYQIQKSLLEFYLCSERKIISLYRYCLFPVELGFS